MRADLTGPNAPEREAAGERWPDFFIVGAQNSATTSLYWHLRQHPQVFMPALKEPHHFSQLAPPNQLRFLVTQVHSRSEYLKLFVPGRNTKTMGEASTSYLWEPGTAQRIHRENPNARIIAVLRDPVERAYSHYQMDRREGWQDRPFLEALQADHAAPRKGYGISRLYVELGLYYEQIKRYLDLFGPDRVKTISFDRFGDKAAGGLARELALFLGIDPPAQANARIERVENEFRVARFDWTRRLAGNWFARRAGQIIVSPSRGSIYAIKRKVFEPLFLKRAERPPIDADGRAWLISIYRDDVAALENLLHRPMPALRRSWQE
ncbi:MAG: sulfotransferase [Candidatus Binataceae bacterium]